MPQELREVALHEVTIEGQPGNIVAVFKRGGPEFQGYPTKVIAWGPIDAEGKFKCFVPDNIGDEVVVGEYDPCMAEHFETYGHVNTEA